MFGSLSSTGPSFLERRVYCCNGANHMQTQPSKKPKQWQPSPLHIWEEGKSVILRPHCESVPHDFSSQAPWGFGAAWQLLVVAHSRALARPIWVLASVLVPTRHHRHLAQARAFSMDSHFCPFILLALSFLLCFLEQRHVFQGKFVPAESSRDF